MQQKNIWYKQDFTKGKIEIYDPSQRQITDEIGFQFIPNDVVVKYNPNYEFLSAPQGLRNFAQFGSTKPRVISFELMFMGSTEENDLKGVDRIQKQLKSLVTPTSVDNIKQNTDVVTFQNIRLAPPLVRLIMGNIVQDTTDKFPIGVISSLSIKGLSVSPKGLLLNRFSADIEFTESTTDYGINFEKQIILQEIKAGKFK
jgi:hypothetical protein